MAETSDQKDDVHVPPIGHRIMEFWRRIRSEPVWSYKFAIPRISTDPKRLVRLLQSKNPEARVLGIRSLAALKYMPNWLCTELVQYCHNAQLLSALALRDSNIAEYARRQRAASALHETNTTLESELRALLTALHPFARDSCVELNTDLALTTERLVTTAEEELLWIDHDDIGDRPTSFASSSKLRKLLIYMEALGLESTQPEQRERMIDARTFSLLHRLWDFSPVLDSADFRLPTLILKTLANLSLASKSAEHFLLSGWISTLAKCRKVRKIELRLLSEKCLANLCVGIPFADESNSRVTYDDGVYVLHDTPDRKRSADVIFVHGLRGGVFYSWRQKDSAKFVDSRNQDTFPDQKKKTTKGLIRLNDSYTYCWPKDWLPRDIGHDVRILGFDYASFVTDWRTKCPEYHERNTIIARSKELLEKLRRAGVGERPIIWVCHSMGGLLVKELLCSSHGEIESANSSKFVDNTIGIVFYSVPHLGSPVASRSVESSYRYFLLPSIEVSELCENSKYLQLLQSCFSGLAKGRIKTMSISETIATKFPMRYTALVVPRYSAEIGFGGHYRLKENHRDVCKPFDRRSINYLILVDFIRSLSL